MVDVTIFPSIFSLFKISEQVTYILILLWLGIGISFFYTKYYSISGENKIWKDHANILGLIIIFFYGFLIYAFIVLPLTFLFLNTLSIAFFGYLLYHWEVYFSYSVGMSILICWSFFFSNKKNIDKIKLIRNTILITISCAIFIVFSAVSIGHKLILSLSLFSAYAIIQILYSVLSERWGVQENVYNTFFSKRKIPRNWMILYIILILVLLIPISYYIAPEATHVSTDIVSAEFDYFDSSTLNLTKKIETHNQIDFIFIKERYLDLEAYEYCESNSVNLTCNIKNKSVYLKTNSPGVYNFTLVRYKSGVVNKTDIISLLEYEFDNKLLNTKKVKHYFNNSYNFEISSLKDLKAYTELGSKNCSLVKVFINMNPVRNLENLKNPSYDEDYNINSLDEECNLRIINRVEDIWEIEHIEIKEKSTCNIKFVFDCPEG